MNVKDAMHTPMGRLHVVWSIACLLCLFLGLIGGYELRVWKATGRSAYPARCVHIVDGDTIDVDWLYGTNRVRIAGIDCPESRNTKKLRDQAKTYSIKPEVLLKIGKAAKNLGKQKVLNQQVVIAFPHGKIERDAFGRLLAYVEIDGADYGGFLIENGFAYPRPEEHPLIKKYRKLNSKAQKNESGLYGWQE